MSYRHKIIRDLEFVIGTHTELPIIHQGNVSQSFNELNRHLHVSWLDELDKEPDQLSQFLSDKPVHILGRYFEFLMLFWLQNSPHYDLLISQQQIINDGITTSEIDFVVRRHDDGQVLHLECAFKVYMHFEQKKWIGPNAKDSLRKKLATAYDKQQGALHSPDGIRQLVEAGVSPSEDVQFMLFMKGYLFEPHFDKASTQNKWCYHHQIESVPGKQDVWAILDKTYWMTPVILNPNELDVLSWREIQIKLKKHFMQDDHAVLVARLEKRHGLYYEINRMFVVSNNWPN